jgi:hypothetical protein
MSVNIPTQFTIGFSTNIQVLLQQKGAKLRMCVDEGHYTGKQASPVDQVGSVEASKVTSRFGPMPRTDAVLDRRWVFPTDYDLAQMIDRFDKLRLITDPESVYVQNAVYALGRKLDAEIIAAFFGDAKTGEQGGSTTIFPAAQVVNEDVGGNNSRINVQKMITAKEILMANFVDFDNDPVYCGITAKDHSALLNEIQVISSDFAGSDRPVLVDGKVTKFLGMNLVHCELFESLSLVGGEVLLPVWARSGMHLGVWNDITATVSQRHDIQSEPWQAYVLGTFGATRIEEKKIVKIESFRV